MRGRGALARGTPWAPAPEISTGKKDPQPGPQGPPRPGAHSAMGAVHGKKVRAPEGPAGSMNTGRGTASDRQEPSPTPAAAWGLGQALPTGLPP